MSLCHQSFLTPQYKNLGNHSGTLKHSLLLHREYQKMSDHLPGRTPYSLGPPYQGKTPGPSPTCLGFSCQAAGKFPAGRLLQKPHPIHQTLKATSPTLHSNPPIPALTPHPQQPQRNTETQAATTQKGQREQTKRAGQESRPRDTSVAS